MKQIQPYMLLMTNQKTHPEIMLGKGIQGGVLTKEGLSRMKLTEIKAELKKRGIEFKQND